MTWGELKLACLHELGDAMTLAEADSETINRMPTMANAGLQRLATVGRYIKKFFEISQTPLQHENLLGVQNTLEICRVVNDDVSFSANGARSYYFEVDNACTVEIKVDGVTVNTISNTNDSVFTAYKGLVSGNGETVEIVFKAQYPYSYRNVCLYGVTFASDDEVQPFVSDIIYDLAEYAPDIFLVDTANIVYQSGINDVRWSKTTDYDLLPGNKLKLNAFHAGSYRIPYFAYPQKITANTTNDTVIVCEPDGLELLKYYICYHLYKGDDMTLATQWHNDFEEGLGAANVQVSTATVVITVKGCV